MHTLVNTTFTIYLRSEAIDDTDIIDIHNRDAKAVLQIYHKSKVGSEIYLCYCIMKLVMEYPLFVDPILLYTALPCNIDSYALFIHHDILTEIYKAVSEHRYFTERIVYTLYDLNFYIQRGELTECLKMIDYRIRNYIKK